MKLKYFLFLCLSFYILNSTFTIATVRYVSKTGTSTPPYTSWETAADSIQKCINICVDGDTVYVANGVYKETLLINTAISLVGSSMDSTVIDGSQFQSPPINSLIKFNVNFKLKYCTIIGLGQNSQMSGIVTVSAANLNLEFCRISCFYDGLFLGNSSSIVKNCLFSFCKRAISDECPNNNCQGIYSYNIIYSQNGGASPTVYFSYGGYPTFTNNVVIDEGQTTLTGVFSGQKPGAIIKNNLIYGYINEGIGIGTVTSDTTHLINNVITNIGNNFGGISTSSGNRTKTENNILKNNYRAFYTFNTNPFRADYNLFWNIQVLIAGQPFIGDSNIVADPMFVNDTIPIANGGYDFHLQKYSPAIDKGDPSILDVDGSRSDIGMYGGPFGETYTYQDLAPLAPRNLSAVIDSNNIIVRWNRNTEADTSFYKVYRDTVVNFTIDSTKLISSSSDSFFVQLNPHINIRYIYKATCVDNQGNESKPSQELVVDITSVSIDDYPMTISDYVLYQNYPNPFNPSTKIGYQIKERSYVKMMVYDIKGELVSVLVNKEQNSGYYEVEFSSSSIQNQESNIKGLASGIYVYRIEVIGEGNIPVYTGMKKMLLVK